MSRHRNMRHMIAEDDYYYDDDDGYDDYDEGYTAKPKPKKKSNQAATTKKQTTATKPSKTPNKQQTSAKSAAAGGPSNGTASGGVPLSPTPTSSLQVLKSPSRTPPRSRSPVATPQRSSYNPPPELLPSPNERIPLTLVVLGHVDAGKSTVTGHLLHAASSSSNNNTPGNKKQPSSSVLPRTPSNFAWLLDEDEKERQHGITMDIATKQVDTASKFRLVFQDAPGHQDFVPAMITGTATADVALLTVDATAPDLQKFRQLREHVVLAKGLGVHQLLVILNKMDVVGWDQQDWYREKETQVRHVLTTVGYPAHKVRCIPLSGLTGVNLMSRQEQDTETQTLRSWYKGPTLWEALDTFDAPLQQQSKLLEKPLRLVVADVLDGGNSVGVRAKVVSGWIQQGEKLVVLPVGDTTTLHKISSVHQPTVSKTSRQNFAAGELLDGTLTGMDSQRIFTGSVLARPHQRPPLATTCQARLYVVGEITTPLIPGAHVMFHMHFVEVPCFVKSLLRTLDAQTGKTLKERPRALTNHTSAVVKLQLAVPICMEAFTECRALGRFVLRRNGESVAVGRIEEVILE